MFDELSEDLLQLVNEIGEAGLEKMASTPGLAAAVDQHVAAIRDVIQASGDELHAGSLFDYLHGFTNAATDRGWWPGDEYDWETVRVIAVCWMQHQLTT